MVQTAVISGTFVVPDNLSVEQRLIDGSYDSSDGSLTEEHFPVTADQVGEWKWEYLHFGSRTLLEYAIPEINRSLKRSDFRLAKIGHLFSFGEVYPEEQKRHPVIGAGSRAFFNGHFRVPILRCTNSQRQIVCGFGPDWSRDGQFLIVRKC